jgi:hypothetical protein
MPRDIAEEVLMLYLYTKGLGNLQYAEIEKYITPYGTKGGEVRDGCHNPQKAFFFFA